MYKAKIIRANVFEEIPEADNIRVLVYNGMRFIVGKTEINEGDLVCLFPADGQLSHDFCYHNNLYRHAHLNSDISMSGYFDDNRKVRAQPFMGIKSEGFVCTARLFKYIKGDFLFNEGDEFDTVNGNLICEKFLSEATKRAIENSNKVGRKKTRINTEFALLKHFDTGQFDYRVDSLMPGMCLVIITEKLHGTSARTGNVLKTVDKMPWYGSIINNIFKRRVVGYKTSRSYELVSGTRNTILNTRPEFQNPDYGEYYRQAYHEYFEGRLHKGETIFYEIVGYDNNGSPIMGTHSTDKLPKETRKKLTKTIVYSYGCDPQASLPNDIYVYRITHQNEDGIVQDLPWLGIIERCGDLGVKHVPMLSTFYMGFDEFSIDEIKARVTQLVSDAPLSILDQNHVREGVCIRIESCSGMTILKKKTFEFLVMEGIAKEKDAIDLEEIS
jgi:hypothetical protein